MIESKCCGWPVGGPCPNCPDPEVLEWWRKKLRERIRPMTHSDLLAKGPPPPPTAEDVAWDQAPPVGSEVI